ncbi:type II toxin-antitoxin system CcdA family antitoxin [Flaviflagellibacter deserti]|uniref:Type II toxin-antitoxin system CcdA family antitoxin n=1 Tax=Flaviflagellibacter deserti TaxID=2267266 RepID=A0ABV9Z3W3_9HYPH
MSSKRAVNLSVDAELLDEAKAMGINLSHLAEAALSKAIRLERERRWRAENRTALEDFDRYVSEHGVFG